MSYVYQNVVIGETLTVKSTGKVITTTKGDIITQDDNHSIRLPVGTNGQVIVADSSASSGLNWRNLNPSDIGLSAGDGLVLTGDTLNVGGSSTILANPDSLEVNSSGTANQVLLSSGTVGTAAIYGAVPLNSTNSVTGVLPIGNGGTGVSSFSGASRLLATNASNTGLVSTSLDPNTIVTLSGTQTLQNKTLDGPKINNILDANNNEIIKMTPTASAVNEINITNAATGNAPQIVASGDDTNIDLKIDAKGTGNVIISSIEFPNTDGTINQVLATDGAGILRFIDVPVINYATTTTTDNTPTTLSSLTISTLTDTVYFVESKSVAKETNPGSKAASFVVRGTFRNTGGTLTLEGIDVVYAPVTTLWNAQLSTSGTDIIVQVTGSSGETVQWKTSTNILSI